MTEAVRRKPDSVNLLDEIEKAHGDVFNTFLQILDDGRLTDSQGRTVDFRNSIIIMTSNIGSAALLEGIDASGEFTEGTREEVMGELRRHFRPEFLNRVDETVLFRPLRREQIKSIVYLLLESLQKRLMERKIAITLTDEAAAFIADAAYDPVYGADPCVAICSATWKRPWPVSWLAEKSLTVPRCWWVFRVTRWSLR